MHVELYTREQCPYCFRAKTLLINHQIPFIERKLGIDFTREHLVEKYSEAKLYPVVVVDGFFIGGYEELNKYINEHYDDGGQYLLNEEK